MSSPISCLLWNSHSRRISEPEVRLLHGPGIKSALCLNQGKETAYICLDPRKQVSHIQNQVRRAVDTGLRKSGQVAQRRLQLLQLQYSLLGLSGEFHQIVKTVVLLAAGCNQGFQGMLESALCIFADKHIELGLGTKVIAFPPRMYRCKLAKWPLA